MGNPRQVLIAHHLDFTGYGHWLPNDIRGSWSTEVKNERLPDLAPIHSGRKTRQPSRQELRQFYEEAEPLLQCPMMLFDESMRRAIAAAFHDVAKERGYTIYACAVLRRHAHLCARAHRDRGPVMWQYFADASRQAVRALLRLPHPIWSECVYTKYLFTPQRVIQVIDYICDNPEKEGLPRQAYDFVAPYRAPVVRKGR